MPRAEWAQVAHDLRALAESIDAAIEPSGARPDVQGASRPAAAEAGVPPAPASAFTSCPKHGKPFSPSKNPEWPAYCRETTDDPAWGKPKNDRDGNPVMYCRITSRNAGEYLAVHKAAPQMDSEEGLPF